MNLPFLIARRYLFSRKSHHAIHLISLVSVLGVAAATLAMVCTLSAFNGFQDLIASMYRQVDPDLTIQTKSGKVFSTNTDTFALIQQHPQVSVFCETLEGNVLVRYKDSQTSARLKGVAASYPKLASIDSCLVAGHFALEEYGLRFANIGAGLASTLNTGRSFIDPIEVYAPKRKTSVNLLNPAASFNCQRIALASHLSIGQPDFDDRMLIVPLDFARQTLDFDSCLVSSVELKLCPDSRINTVKKQLSELLGEAFTVQDCYEQKAEFYRINRMEKWITYLILSFILLIALFNVIGSLSMLILEKKHDASILYKLGMTRDSLRKVFLYEGLLIAFCGALLGIGLGSLLCLFQEWFGLLKLGDGHFVVEAYPVSLKATDLLFVLVTVLAISLPSVHWPIRYVFGKNDA